MLSVSPRVIRIVSSVLIVVFLTGCEATRAYRPTGPNFADEAPRKGEVFLHDGSSLKAREIFVLGDSILAYQPGKTGVGVEPQIRLARSDVVRIESTYLKQPETTILGLAGGAAAVAGLVWLITTDFFSGFSN